MKSDFEERKARRIERYEELAENAEQHSQDLYDESHKMASAIPFGQPILVGHHSEKSDRAYRKRIHNKMDKSVEESQKAQYYRNKAKAAANNQAIFSDDPKAIQKLKAKIEKAEERQEAMKKANKVIKSKKKTNEQKVGELQAMGYSLDEADTLLHPDCFGNVGFSGYRLKNNNANIRRMKQRLEQLQKAETEETTEKEINGVTICDNVEDNRVQLYFPDKPNEEIRTFLKSHGFRWTRSLGAWQRHRSTGARYWAEEAAKKYQP